MKIVVLDGHAANPGDLSWKGLEEIGELTVYERSKPDEAVARAADAEIVLTNKVVFTKEVIEKLPKLRYIGVLATGYNIVDTVTARERGIAVTNVPAYSTESVAQMVFALLLMVTNRTEHYADQNRKGRWSANPDFCYWDTNLTEIAGKEFGVVGLGNIGMRVAAIADMFGMKVSAYTSKDDSQLPHYVKKKTMEEILAESDVVSLHCPLLPDTHHLINRENLRKMKPTAILINTGRGPLVDDEAVAEALEAGRLAAFCADVLTEEPPRADNPLLRQPNAFITPHIAWASKDARNRLIQVAIDNVRSFVSGNPRNVVS